VKGLLRSGDLEAITDVGVVGEGGDRHGVEREDVLLCQLLSPGTNRRPVHHYI